MAISLSHFSLFMYEHHYRGSQSPSSSNYPYLHLIIMVWRYYVNYNKTQINAMNEGEGSRPSSGACAPHQSLPSSTLDKEQLSPSSSSPDLCSLEYIRHSHIKASSTRMSFWYSHFIFLPDPACLITLRFRKKFTISTQWHFTYTLGLTFLQPASISSSVDKEQVHSSSPSPSLPSFEYIQHSTRFV